MSESAREKIIRLVNEMRQRTVDRGCTPAEAAAFAAKAAEWVEKYQIEEAELRAKEGKPGTGPTIEVTEDYIRTGKKCFSPGVTQVVNALANAMSCECIMLHRADGEAVYGITGDSLDTDYVGQIALTVIPSLELSANLEGIEHGYKKAALVRWRNQYLTGASIEIRKRILEERRLRSDMRAAEGKLSGALVVVTGEQLALAKRLATEVEFKRRYPRVRRTTSRMEHDPRAFSRGQEAGKRVGLHIGVKDGGTTPTGAIGG